MKGRITLTFLIFYLCYSLTALSQELKVSGTVSGEKGETLPGVSITIKGAGGGAQTGQTGTYSLNVPNSKSVLVFSYLGYTRQEIAVNGKSTINVVLKEDNTALEEVVVVGYGTQKLTKVSGAISTVKAADIEKQKPLRAEEALQGRASGVSVIQNGSPGSKPTVLIRGIPSFSGTEPVVIVDGVPQSLDDLNAINSNDIESINVLKDAATTAIYGVKGGNGVIVVTTKSGRKNQKTEITLGSYYGQQEAMNQIGVLNASEYAAIINEGSVTSGGGLIFPDISSVGLVSNWQDEIFKKAAITSNNITARGGSEKVTYFLSGGYLGQGGIVGGSNKSNFNRANATANLNFDFSSKVKLILNTNYVNIRNKGVQENSFNSIIGSALNFDPTVPVMNTVPNTVGTYGYSNLIVSEIFNPLTKLENTFNESNGDKFFGKAELQYGILKNLTVTSRLGYVKWNQNGKSFVPLVFYGPLNVENTMNATGNTITGSHNSVSEYQNSNLSLTSETFTNYNFKINDSHNFETVLGFSLSKSSAAGYNVSRQDVPFNSWDFADITSATGVNSSVNTNASAGSNYQTIGRRNLSYFGRLNYDYQEKYLASISARSDGSIAFGANDKFASFYAGSLGWIVSKEGFFNSDFINYLKIRGSYGSIGNENVDPQFVKIETGGSSYGETANSNGYTFGSTFLPGSTVNTFKNEVLRWEKQLQMNAGFDVTVLKNKLSLTADYFQKNVEGLLFKDASPLYAGTSIPVDANIGSTKSSGVDLTLAYNETSSRKFKFNTSVTFTTSKNLVTETNKDGTKFRSGGDYFNGQPQSVTRFQKGFTPGYFYGFKTDGLFQTVAEVDASPSQLGAVPGDIRFVDVNGDGKITDLDRTKIGDPFAKFTMGWNLGFNYKNFDLNVFTYASVGNDIYRAYERNMQYSNKFRSILDRWTGAGTTNNAKNPRYSFSDANSNIRASDRYVEDGSFIKIKNLVLGYNVPKSLLRKTFSNVRIYAQVKNLYTFTKYSGYDPEISGGILNTGVDRGDYPQARTISAGLDLKF